MYQDGARIVDICAALGCSDTTVYRALEIEGVPVRSRAGERQDRRARVVDMYMSGMTVSAISKAMGIQCKTVSGDLSGIKRRPLNPKYVRDKLGLSLGVGADVTPDALDIIARKIRRGETILSCMARLIVQDGCRDKKE